MPIKKNILIPLLILFICTFAIILYNKDQSQEIDKVANTDFGKWASVFATGECTPSKHNVTGWAYAEPIGAISLNCGNTGTSTVDYGVNINENFSPDITCSGTINCDDAYAPVYTGSKNYYHVRITGTGNGGSGTITIPDNVYSVDVTVVGGGAAGGAQFGASSGGAGGYVVNRLGYAVNPGDIINITVGAGGVYSSDTNLKKGKGSVFGSIQTGDTDERSTYSSGGSGGGYGYTSPVNGGPGGSDGYPAPLGGGNGQYPLKTTSEIDKLLYSGGGGGGTSVVGRSGGVGGNDYSGKAGNGGSSSTNYNGQNAQMHTGSGGGGGARNLTTGQWGTPGTGGSGVIILRYLKPQSKELSGYAWSPAVGPISFNASQICKHSPCLATDFPDGNGHIARVDYVSDGVAKITGWARALGACDFENGHCTTNEAGSDAGGWDGWIKFNKDTETIDYDKGDLVGWRSNCGNPYCGFGDYNGTVSPMCEALLSSCSSNPASCLIEFEGTSAVCAFPVYEHGGEGVVYNTYIQSIGTAFESSEGQYKQHFIRGTAWGGDVLDERNSAVLGEIVFLNAETTYNPNNACVGRQPAIPSFTLGCRKVVGTTCYFDATSSSASDITLSNTTDPLDPDDSACELSTTNLQTSRWTNGGKGMDVAANKPNISTTFNPRNSTQYPYYDEADFENTYQENIKLTVTDDQGLQNSKTVLWTMAKAIDANFSCCVGAACDGGNNSAYVACSGLGEVVEGERLYLRDNVDVPKHTYPSSGQSVSSRVWSYNMGDVLDSDEGDKYIIISAEDGAAISLNAKDPKITDEVETKTLESIFGSGNIIKNPDFKEIPFD